MREGETAVSHLRQAMEERGGEPDQRKIEERGDEKYFQ